MSDSYKSHVIRWSLNIAWSINITYVIYLLFRCQFLNFRKNHDCRKCSAKRPENSEMQNVVELEPGDWKCPEYVCITFCLSD